MMIKKSVLILLSVSWGTLAFAQPFTGGIALKETEGLSKGSIALPKGDPRPLIALAMRHGKAQGHLSGDAAKHIKMKMGREVPVSIIVTKGQAVKNQPGCNEIELFFSSPIPTGYSEEKIKVVACPNAENFGGKK